jgi:hypothetical protein
MKRTKPVAFSLMLLCSLLLAPTLGNGHDGLTALFLGGFAFANLLILAERNV